MMSRPAIKLPSTQRLLASRTDLFRAPTSPGQAGWEAPATKGVRFDNGHGVLEAVTLRAQDFEESRRLPE